MGRQYIVLTLLAAASATGFRLQNNTGRLTPYQHHSNYAAPYLREPESIYEALIHLDGRPTEILIDKLGDQEDLRFQTGDPVAKPYPFIGALGTVEELDGGRSFSYSLHCASSLIDRQTILTAAHCVLPKRGNRKNIFVFGLSDVRVDGSNYLAKKKHFSEIESITAHPDYDKSTVTNDVAVGRLSQPLSSSQGKPICLGGTGKHNTNMVGAGWGRKTCFDSSKDTLRKAKSTLVDQQECERKHWPLLLNQQICTLFKTENGRASAAGAGDSGGPLFSLANPTNPVQVGIASFVRTLAPHGPLKYCVRTDVPQVYARVTSFKDFINGIGTNVQWC